MKLLPLGVILHFAMSTYMTAQNLDSTYFLGEIMLGS